MNSIPVNIFEYANEAAIYNLYLYLAHKSIPTDGSSLRVIAADLEDKMKNQHTRIWKPQDIQRLRILKNAVDSNTILANSVIGNLTLSSVGMTACTFTKPNGEIFVIFKGTGSGEWIDNGEGLSGIPEENTYIIYGENGKVLSYEFISEDYASDQQAEALNWFNRVAAENNWNDNMKIILSGHSKGGNKAQFITMHSKLADICLSFNGQGFSPEALTALKNKYGEEYESRRQKIHSFAADNDFVNVLGKRIVPENQIYYFEASIRYHQIESILYPDGRLRLQTEQGRLSKYAESVSDDIMALNPLVRQYAALGIMNIFQKHLGKSSPVNDDNVSAEETIAGMSVAFNALLRHIRNDLKSSE